MEATLTLILVAVMLRGTAALQVTISPERIHLLTIDEDLTVQCVADVALTHCQLRIEAQPHVDLSRGSYSNVPGFRYEGEGLEAGHCGATISPAVLPAWGRNSIVECRVRTATSDWSYATMAVYRYSYTNILMTTKSRRLVVVPPGGEVRHLFQAEELLTRCDLKHPQLGWKNLVNHPMCESSADSICYYGRGLNKKQCGATITNITDKSNGIVWFHLETAPGVELDHVQIIVKKPPDTPVLTAFTTRNVNGSTTLRAVCTVSGSRPAANITWILNDEVVTGGSLVFLTDDRWVLQFEEQTTTQQLTMIMEESAGGKDLWCITHHVALPVPISSNKIKMVVPKIRLVDPCEPSPCEANQRCWSSDEDALCECLPGLYRSPGEGGCGVERPADKECADNMCVDRCSGVCGVTAIDHRPMCSCPSQPPMSESQGFPGSEAENSSSQSTQPRGSCCSPTNHEEQRVRLLQMDELHQLQVQAEQARATLEEQNAEAARARARVEEENVMAARARTKNAEEELVFQRELRRIQLLQLSEKTSRD